MIITQLNVSLIATALIGVKFSQVCPQHDEHIAVQTRPALPELHFSLQATQQPQLIIYSTRYAAAAWTVAISDNEQSVISQPNCSLLKRIILWRLHQNQMASSSYLVVSVGFIMSGIWIMNTFERLLMFHTIEHYDMLSGHAYARALRSHFLTAASLTALILDTSSLMHEIDVRRLLYVHSSLL